MGSFAGARDLRDLLGVAIKLRALADAEIRGENRTLYLTAAEALEARAEQMAHTLPGERADMPDTYLHQRVNLII